MKKKKAFDTKPKSEWKKNVMKILQILLLFWEKILTIFASKKKEENT
jgi:hypothetical protein